MKTWNPTMMWFSKKNVQKLEDKQSEDEIIELKLDDVLKTTNVAQNVVKINEENTSEMTKLEDEKNLILNKINVVVDAVKSALGVQDEIENATVNEVQEPEVVAEVEQPVEEPQDVQEETVSEETEVVVQEQEKQPKNEPEENEPSEGEPVEAEPKEEIPAEEGQEEPAVEEQEEVAEEQPAEEAEEIVEEPKEEIPAETNEVAEPVKVNVVSAESEVKTADLLKEIENLKNEKAEKELELQKLALSKEVEKDYMGVPGKLEDKVDMIFEIKNSALSDNVKNVIFTSLKQLSSSNLQDCEEIGHSQEVEVDEKAERELKIKDAMEKYGLTSNQAFLFVNGDRSLAEAKKASARVQSKKK